eukprot:scaffold1718_cov81-Skeletonema_dohrnii-CCMP3373.AAC.4
MAMLEYSNGNGGNKNRLGRRVFDTRWDMLPKNEKLAVAHKHNKTTTIRDHQIIAAMTVTGRSDDPIISSSPQS